MISHKDIEDLAALSRLTLSDAEMGNMEKDFSAILDYVGQVSSVAATDEGIALAKNRNVFREDTARAAGDIMAGKEKNVIAAFPEKDGDYLVVRKIIDK